mmetsp:Transcript_19766/g.63825  ORF Transcript_19766/g.63825 Transcript_19766/m.63825 type:complete len:259 (+) Transcript_19766:190-966(+)
MLLCNNFAEVLIFLYLPFAVPDAGNLRMQPELVCKVPEETRQQAMQGCPFWCRLGPAVYHSLARFAGWVHEPDIVTSVGSLHVADGRNDSRVQQALVLQIRQHADILQIVDHKQTVRVAGQSPLVCVFFLVRVVHPHRISFFLVRVVHTPLLGPHLHEADQMLHSDIQVGIRAQKLRVVSGQQVVEGHIDGHLRRLELQNGNTPSDDVLDNAEIKRLQIWTLPKLLRQCLRSSDRDGFLPPCARCFRVTRTNGATTFL